jgi:hypothetical protein
MARGIIQNAAIGAMCSLVVLAAPARAVLTEVEVFFDTDAGSGTGCTVTTVDGNFTGVESILRFDFDWGTGEVVSSTSQTCVDPVSSTFSSPTAVTGPESPPWTIAPGQGIDGATAVEAYAPAAMLPGASPGSLMRIGVATSTAGGDDALITVDGQSTGGDIFVALVALLALPTGSVWATCALILALLAAAFVTTRRAPDVAWFGALGLLGLLAVAGAARAAGGLDGAIEDWQDLAPAAADAQGDAGTGADIAGVWVRVDLIPPTDGGPGFGTLSGDLGALASETGTASPSQFDTHIDFGTDPFTEPEDVALLTLDAQTVYNAATSGGSSLYSEVFSMDSLVRGEGALLVKTEAEVVYDVPGPLIDMLIDIGGTRLGVSVTRAITFPTGETVPVADAMTLLNDKLGDLLASRTNVSAQDAFAKGILHVFVENDASAANVVTALGGIDATTLGDTIVLVTVTDGDDLWLFGF